MADTITVDGAPENQPAKTTGFREIHFIGALLAAAILMAGLFSAPWTGAYLRKRQIHAVQQSVIVDLNLVAESEAKFLQQNGTYTTDMRALGIKPKRVMYKFGFAQAADPQLWNDPQHRPELKDLDALKASDAELQIIYSGLTKLNKISFDEIAKFCSDCTATREAFKVVAAANLDDDEELDVWTIDHKGEVVHVNDDFKEAKAQESAQAKN